MQILKFINKPNILLLYSNMVGEQVKKYLEERKEHLIGCFTHELITKDELMNCVKASSPDVIITCYWPYLLDSEVFESVRYGCINFHPALLPRNRGWYPSVWEVLEAEEYRAGVTLHLIDENADTGPIIAQKQFDVKEIDTGGTVYGRSQLMMIDLFKETWEQLYNGGAVLHSQNNSLATYHTKKETNELDEIILEKVYKAKDLFNLIKAKTFKDKSYAYYIKDGKKYNVKIEVCQDGT